MSDQRVTGPIRKINSSSRSMTGAVPSFGVFESALERDMMEILRFDQNVLRFTPQPLTIEFRDAVGKTRRYTPDGLIEFKSETQMSPILYEVKFRADFRKDWRTLMPKFRAAKKYCVDRNSRFEVFTEREIRTPYLANARFLWPFRERTFSPELKEQVLSVLWDLEQADPELLLYALRNDPTNRAALIPVVWNLVASGAIGCDLDQPLTMRSPIWPKEAF